MRDGPAEINLYLDNLFPANGENLSVAESFAIHPAFISNKHSVTIRDQINELKGLGLFAVFPAAVEVGFPVNTIVEGTGKVKVIGDQFLNCRSIFLYIRFIAGSCDGDNLICRSRMLLGSFGLYFLRHF